MAERYVVMGVPPGGDRKVAGGPVDSPADASGLMIVMRRRGWADVGYVLFDPELATNLLLEKPGYWE
jgi:hypothetical protein